MSGSVSLNCTSCGSPLKIASVDERFYCGNCGTPFFIRRGGGIVYLVPGAEQHSLPEHLLSPSRENSQASNNEVNKEVENPEDVVKRQVGDYVVKQQPLKSPSPETSLVHSEPRSSDLSEQNLFLELPCYRCNSNAIGQCEKDNSYYCSRHGNSGYCESCIDKARYSTPISIRVIGWTFYLFAGVLFLLVGLALGGLDWIIVQLDPEIIAFSPYGGSYSIDLLSNEFVSSVKEFITPFLLAFLCLPVLIILFGRAFNSGSEAAKWMVIILSIGLVVLSATFPPSLIFGLGFLLLIYKERHWYKLRKLFVPYRNWR